MNHSESPELTLARQLMEARQRVSPIADLSAELIPSSAQAACVVQQACLTLAGASLGGWKVGAKSLTGPIQGAPLPIEGLHPSPATVKRSAFGVLGLELEIAFYFGRVFEPREQPYSDEEVGSGLKAMAATIEIVSSRFAAWPKVDKLAQLADLQNHGALIVGQPVPYQATYPFTNPSMTFSYDGADIILGESPFNPAGDPRRLLPWLVNHCIGQGVALTPEMIVTAGSYSGVHFPDRPGTAIGQIAGLPPVQLVIE